MKEFLDIFIFQPKKTERMVVFVLKASFAFCYSIWVYKYLGCNDIIEQITNIDSLNYFLFNGHFILFIFLFLLLYFLFFKFSTTIFSIIGIMSMWILQVAFKFILNVLAFIFSLIAWPKLRSFKYKPFWKIMKDNEPLNDIGYFIKWIFLKAGILKSPEQKIHSSKEASELLKEMKDELIDNRDKVYDKIHTRFILGVLLYVFYFYYLHDNYQKLPYVDNFIFYFCLITILLQLLSYWAYNHSRVLYYVCLLSYRGIHRQDLFSKPLEELLVEFQETEEMSKE